MDGFEAPEREPRCLARGYSVKLPPWACEGLTEGLAVLTSAYFGAGPRDPLLDAGSEVAKHLNSTIAWRLVPWYKMASQGTTNTGLLFYLDLFSFIFSIITLILTDK